ncbi:hypothetical protein VKT23_002893 [Stygiomarasmius scandens]|uniref:Fe2OG dioxygenase domain-containing protein n=1 Tax=Marasmiellus scandens TaxID=2682957 RepID=A0ABR1K1X8_9AGAR
MSSKSSSPSESKPTETPVHEVQTYLDVQERIREPEYHGYDCLPVVVAGGVNISDGSCDARAKIYIDYEGPAGLPGVDPMSSMLLRSIMGRGLGGLGGYGGESARSSRANRERRNREAARKNREEGKANSKLINALSRASLSPWIHENIKPRGWFYEKIRDLKFGIVVEDEGERDEKANKEQEDESEGEDTEEDKVKKKLLQAGTIARPNTSVILAKAKPSSFGKGEETVFDPTYRNGLEIPAEKISFPDASVLKKHIESVVANNLFRNRKKIGKRSRSNATSGIHVKLYKLAVYEKGGHFDWHMDSTHGDNHHATALLFLGSKWNGGELKLRHGGHEFSTKDIKDLGGKEDVYLVAFYTDVEHKVEPVEDGTRIVLQFDVFVDPPAEDDEEGYDTDTSKGPIALAAEEADEYPVIDGIHPESGALEEVAKIIEEKLNGENQEDRLDRIAFPLQHLYRLASIRPEYLKGADAMLYEYLSSYKSGIFDVELHPVLLQEETNSAGRWIGDDSDAVKPQAWVFDSEIAEKGKRKRQEDAADVKSRKRARGPGSSKTSDTSDEDEDEDESKNFEKQEFHLLKNCSLAMVEETGYVEYTGNEAQLGSAKYFGGGMFITMKK